MKKLVASLFVAAVALAATAQEAHADGFGKLAKEVKKAQQRAEKRHKIARRIADSLGSKRGTDAKALGPRVRVRPFGPRVKTGMSLRPKTKKHRRPRGRLSDLVRPTVVRPGHPHHKSIREIIEKLRERKSKLRKKKQRQRDLRGVTPERGAEAAGRAHHGAAQSLGRLRPLGPVHAPRGPPSEEDGGLALVLGRTNAMARQASPRSR